MPDSATNTTRIEFPNEAFEPTPNLRRISYVVPPESEGRAVGDVLRRELCMSRRGVIRAKYTPGGILLDGIPVRTNMPVRAGQEFSVLVGDKPELVEACGVGAFDREVLERVPGFGKVETGGFGTDEVELEVLFEDEDLLAVNKPAGLVMYPGAGREANTLGNLVMSYLKDKGEQCVLHPVQRLDRGTGGLVLFAKNAYAQSRLSAMLHTGDFIREYVAYCWGKTDESGVIEGNIARLQKAPGIFGLVPEDDPRGKFARTNFWRTGYAEVPAGPVTESGVISRVRLRLDTGRTHQIRIHMASRGWPLLGDSAYGIGSAGFGQTKIGTECLDGSGIMRPALHSAFGEFTHPITRQRIALHAPLPKDLVKIDKIFNDDRKDCHD